MPLYEYQCTKCESRFERIEKVSGPHLRKCPSCTGRVERMMSAPAIQFKGSGWYVTDYGGRGAADKAKEDSGKKDAAAQADSGKKEPAAKDSAKDSLKGSPKESKKESSSSKDKT